MLKHLVSWNGITIQNNSSSNLSKITVMSLVISSVYFSGFKQVLACKETSHVKVSNLYKWWKCMLKIVFLFRSSHRRCSVRKGVLRNFAKFTEEHLCQSLFFNKVRPKACNFIKKETLSQVFSFAFCGISKYTFFIEHLRATASAFSLKESE